MNRKWIVGLALWSALGMLSAGEAFLPRHPALSPDGKQIAFSFQGDIWTVPVQGGDAKRLTAHEAYEARPTWSPNGQQLAFESDRRGSSDLYTMDAEGGNLKRLTHFSGGDGMVSWSDDNRLLFNSVRAFAPFFWEPEVHIMPAAGGTPQRFLDELGREPVLSPDGRFVAFVRGYVKYTRKRYDGPAAYDIWLYDTQNDRFSQLTTHKNVDRFPRWIGNRELLFTSERDGAANVYQIEVDDEGLKKGEPRQVTNYEAPGIRWFGTDKEGNNLVVEFGSGFYFGATGSELEKVNIQVPEDSPYTYERQLSLSGDALTMSVSPNGKYVAFDARGEIFIVSNDPKKGRTVRLTNHPFRDREPVFLNDHTLLFRSDRDGQDDLYLLKPAEGEVEDLFFAIKKEVVRLTENEAVEAELILSPKRDKLSYVRDRGDIIVVDVNKDMTLGKETVIDDHFAPPESVVWSPDGKWLAYSQPDLNFNYEVFIAAADASQKPTNVSMHPRNDYSPSWSPKGDKLAFASERNNGDSDIWFIWLNIAEFEKSKLDREYERPEPKKDEPEPAKKDKKDKKGKKKDGDKDEDEDEDEKDKDVEPIKIDFKDIHRRIIQVTRLAEEEGNPFFDHESETIVFTASADTGRGSDFYSVKWDGEDLKKLTKKGMPVSRIYAPFDKKHQFFLSSGKIKRMEFGKEKIESIGYKAEMTLNRREERRQIYNEAWRFMRENFYDPKMHGVDWQKVGDYYRPLAVGASTREDFEEMIDHLLGELNASHLDFRYGRGDAPYDTEDEKSGALGIEFKPTAKGMEVTRVLPESPADKTRSKLNVGEYVTAVNGTAFDAVENFYELLTGTAGEEVLLTVVDNGGKSRDVLFRPVSSNASSSYKAWVEQCRSLVDTYSNGRIGWVHVPSMDLTSYENFETELVAAGHEKEALIIDVRSNNGGWTTDLLMAVLNTRRHAYTIPRGAAADLETEKNKFVNFYPVSERNPNPAWMKPVAAMCNTLSYSNAEIFSHAFKTLGHGPLVGTPTYGAVISTGGTSLIDGSWLRMPYRGWYVSGSNMNMENGPAVPDIIVEQPAGDYARGIDTQLKATVDALLKELDNQ